MSTETFYQELAWNPHTSMFGTGKFAFFLRYLKKKYSLIFQYQQKSSNYYTRSTDKIAIFHTKHIFFKNFSSICCYRMEQVIHCYWIELPHCYINLPSAASLPIFTGNMLKFTRASPSSAVNRHNCEGIKYHTRLCFCLSHLNEPKFKLSFQDTLNPFCLCGLHFERRMHLYCPKINNLEHSYWHW